MLEQFTVADILTWLDDKTLVVNRDFQRSGKVWPAAAKAYLIDTILRGLPMPKIYLRIKTNTTTRRSYREVVDGQQRLLAIQSFAEDEFRLGSSREVFDEFARKRYSDLDEEDQRKFLEYMVSAEQLMSVSDHAVFDIFQRLNTYNYNLSPQELRHGKYHGQFRNSVVEASRYWGFFWDKHKILNNRVRVRMGDDELMAQIFGIILEGVTDGGQPKTERLYKNYDADMPSQVSKRVDGTMEYIDDNLSPILETGLSGSPHFLMLFAAVAHALFGIPSGDMGDDMPPQDSRALEDVSIALHNLSALADVLERESTEVSERFHEFQYASAGTTQRIRSRRIRFQMLYKALLPVPI